MKNIIKTAILVSLFTSFSIQASTYWGGQLSKGNVKATPDDLSISYDSTVLSAIFGSKVNENVALEARLGYGVSNENLAGTEISIDTAISLFGKFGSEISRNVYPYLALGYTHANVEFVVPGTKVDADDGNYSYGVGMDILLDDESRINIEYMDYFDKDDISYDALSIGYLKNF